MPDEPFDGVCTEAQKDLLWKLFELVRSHPNCRRFSDEAKVAVLCTEPTTGETMLIYNVDADCIAVVLDYAIKSLKSEEN